MGWKMCMVAARANEVVDTELCLNALGYSELIPIDLPQPLEAVLRPEESVIYAGWFQNIFIVLDCELPYHFYSDHLSYIENKWIQYFGVKTEIQALTLQSVVNHYGFAVISNGEKIRVKVGDSEQPVGINHGNILVEEKQFFNHSKMQDNQRIFLDPDLEGEAFSEDAMGEEFVFAVSQRLFGIAICNNEELLNTEMFGYRKPEKDKKKKVKSKSNNKFWTLIVLISALFLGIYALLKWGY